MLNPREVSKFLCFQKFYVDFYVASIAGHLTFQNFNVFQNFFVFQKFCIFQNLCGEHRRTLKLSEHTCFPEFLCFSEFLCGEYRRTLDFVEFPATVAENS